MIHNSSLSTKGLVVLFSVYSALTWSICGAEARPTRQFSSHLTEKIAHPVSRKGGYSLKVGQRRDTTSDCQCDDTSANNESMDLVAKAWKLRDSNPYKSLDLVHKSLQIDDNNQYAWIAAAYLLRGTKEGTDSLLIATTICNTKSDAEGLEIIEQLTEEYYS
jgi:hypothetical protein